MCISMVTMLPLGFDPAIVRDIWGDVDVLAI